jgi:HK97 family phage prohead protease
MSVKSKSFTVKALDDQSDYQFEGYASTFYNTDRDGDVFEKGSFTKTVNKKSTVPLLFNHDRNIVIGKMELSIDNTGLLAKGYLNLNDPKAQNIYDLMKMGALDSMSVGFAVKDYEPIEINRPFGGWTIKEAELYEVSVVTIPANDKALIQNVKYLEAENEANWLYSLVKKSVSDAILQEEKRKELLDSIQNLRRQQNDSLRQD